jgi:hypothetical protein
LLGKISGVRISAEKDPKEKWLILISEFARINYPNLWDHGRNPIRYTSLETLRIDPDGMEFQALPNISEHLARSEPRLPTLQRPTIMREKAPFSSYAREKFWQAVVSKGTQYREQRA